MAYKSPVIGMFSRRDENTDEEGEGGSRGSGGTSRGGYRSPAYGMFTARRKRQEDEEEERLQHTLVEEEQADKRQAEANSRKNIFERAGDIKRGVGNFVKEAALDVKDTAVESYQGIRDTVQGVHEGNKLEDQTEEMKKVTGEWSDYMRGLKKDDFKKPEVKKRLAEFKARTDEIKNRSNAIMEGKEWKEAEAVDPLKTAMASGETFLNVATLGFGKQLLKQGGKTIIKRQVAKQVFKTGGREALEHLVKQGIKEGGEKVAKDLAQEAAERAAKRSFKTMTKRALKTAGKEALLGTGYGVTQTGKNDPDADLDDYLMNMAFGAGIGAAIPVVGGTAATGIRKGAARYSANRAAKTAAREATEKAVKVTVNGGDDDLNRIMNEAIEEQSGKYATSKLTQVKNWLGNTFDPNREFAKIDEMYAKQNGIKRNKLAAGESLEDLARRSAVSEREAAGLFQKKLRTGKSMKDLVVKYGGDTDAGKEFNNYTNAKFDLEFRQKHKGKRVQSNIDDEQLEKFIKSYEAKNPDALDDLATKKAANDEAIDYLVKTNVMTAEEANLIKSSYEFAVPLDRIFPDDLARVQIPGKNVGSISKQTVVQRLVGNSDIPISNSFDSMLNRVYKSVAQGNRAKLAQKLLERQEQGLIKGAQVVVTAGNKEARREIRSNVQVVNKAIRTMSKKLSMNNKQVRRLESELNKLNKEGVAAATAPRAASVAPTPVKTVTVKTVREQIKDNAPKTLDDLNQSYEVKATLLKEYGKGAKAIDQMAADIYNGGYEQLMALNPNISKATAKSIAGQILKKPTVKAGKIVVTESRTRQPSMRSVVKQLFDAPPAEVERIKKKIATRDAKLATKIDEVMAKRSELEALGAFKTDMKAVTADFMDDPTTGKQIISGVIDGQSYKMEVPPELAKAVQGLDSQKLTGVLKALAIAKKPFEIAWVGIINPVFSGISFALYDTPMSIINSPQGIRTLGPKAVKESIKSIWSGSDFQKRLAAEGARPYGGTGASAFIKPDAKALAAQKNILTKLKYNATHPGTALSNLDVWGGKLANATRTRVARAEYDAVLRAGKKAGKSLDDPVLQKQAMEQATLAYRTVMPDFDTMSNLTRQVNAVVPFFAASMAGTRSFAKALKRDPVGTGAKALALGIGPTVGVTAFSLMQPAGQEFYADMEASGNSRTLDENMIIVLPGASKDPETGKWNGIIKIPLAPEFRAINKTTWRGVRGAMGGDGPNASHIALSLFDTVTGGVRSSENPLVSTQRILSGEDPRTGEQIIKGDMANLPKEEQAYDTTSTAGRVVAKVLRTSPIQGDKILGQFGLAGQVAKKGSVTEALGSNISNRFSGAWSDSAKDSFFQAYSPLRARRDKASREINDLLAVNKRNEARRRAQEFNETLRGSFTEFDKEFGDSTEMTEDLKEMMNSLFIKDSDEAFNARLRR